MKEKWAVLETDLGEGGGEELHDERVKYKHGNNF